MYVGGEGEAGDLHQQRFIGKRSRVGRLRFDDFALLQVGTATRGSRWIAFVSILVISHNICANR